MPVSLQLEGKEGIFGTTLAVSCRRREDFRRDQAPKPPSRHASTGAKVRVGRYTTG